MKILGKFKEKVGHARWKFFIDDLEAEAASDTSKNFDGISINFGTFLEMLRKGYGIVPSDLDKKMLLRTFSAKTKPDEEPRINLKPILQLKNHQNMINTYKNIQYRLDDF